MDKKKARIKAKKLFTRKRNSLLTAIKEAEDTDVREVDVKIMEVEERLKEFDIKYQEVQEEHESYVSEVGEEENFVEEVENEWISKVEMEYMEIERQALTWIDRLSKMAGSIKEEALTSLTMNISDVEVRKTLRLVEGGNFDQEVKNVEAVLQDGTLETPVKSKLARDGQEKTKLQLERCKMVHAEFISKLPAGRIEQEMKWIHSLYETQLRIDKQVEILNQKECKEKEKEKEKQEQTSILRIERMPLPQFNGVIREYPRFKADFMRQVVPDVASKQSQAYVLKSCLKGSTRNVVDNVDDDVDEMWKRLNERYGRPTLLIDIVMNEIKCLKHIEERDDKGFIELVETIERGYRDLLRLGIEREVSNAATVSLIEGKLPRDIKREWAKKVNSETDDEMTIREECETNKFPTLLKFLLNQKRILEYVTADLRDDRDVKDGSVNHMGKDTTDQKESKEDRTNYSCWVHKSNAHTIANCETFAKKEPKEKLLLVKENRVCWSCLKVGHRSFHCRYKSKCEEDGCQQHHHKLLHECHKQGLTFHANKRISNKESNACLLQLMHIDAESDHLRKGLNVLWDGGATLSLITFKQAKQMKLVGERIILSVVKVGGQIDQIDSYRYNLYLINGNAKRVPFVVYGIPIISSRLEPVKLDSVVSLFKEVTLDEVKRPTGEVDVLIGFEYAGYHPNITQVNEQLVLCENMFGKCVGGSHELIKENVQKVVKHASVSHVMQIEIEEFFNIESLGVKCEPRCGNCRCGKCPIGSKQYTLKEERELCIIEAGLTRKKGYWEARYPWSKSPWDLPDNKVAAVATMKSTERRLLKDKEHAKVYQEQIEDMLERGVAEKLSNDQIVNYDGPVYYICHHEVIKENSSTRVRLVFNASAKFKGHSLNEYWAKGPDLMNNLLGILLRFREEAVAIVGDIKKMYHSVKISILDQHTHRFLWRDMDTKREPDTYIMKVVSFGDKPAGTIATVALRNTAKEFKEKYPREVQLVLENTYMDDLIDSLPRTVDPKKFTQNLNMILAEGGFKVKEWLIADNQNELKMSNSRNNEQKANDPAEIVSSETIGSDEGCGQFSSSMKVLGFWWCPLSDCFQYKIKLNFSEKRRKIRTGPDITLNQLRSNPQLMLTKRIVLSQVNGIFDPVGLAVPFTMKAKMLMQHLWISETKKLSWDEPLGEEINKQWLEFFIELYKMENIRFHRCVKPNNAVGAPTLIMFSDASERAYGTCAYVRWKVENGSFVCSLLASKGRVAPIKKTTIVRLELSAAVMSKRLAEFVKRECRFVFNRRYFIVDSEIVRAMIQKETYGFNTFAGTRIGEIQEETDGGEWYWIEGKQNVADWITRGKCPDEIGDNTLWQKGPDFLYLDEALWPIKQSCSTEEIPEQVHPILNVDVKVDITLSVIDINRFSSYDRLIRVTVMIVNIFTYQKKASLRNASIPITKDMMSETELYWIRIAQSCFTDHDMRTKFKTLCPRRREDGIIIVGTRAEKWMKATYNESNPILLPYHHPLSRLYVRKIHNVGHQGIAATTAKVRLRMWVVKLEKMVKSIRNKCVTCRRLNKITLMQVMGPLPAVRLKPAPAWTSTMLDYFGPYTVKGEVNKRSRGKAYGILFTCLYSRAAHIEVSPDYSTKAFISVLRRFMSIRGCPSSIHSDPGSQLVGANNELKRMVKGLDKDKLKEYGHANGVHIEWKFSTPDSPWKNGCVESLNRSVKRCISAAIGEQVLSYSELCTVMYEVANLINERPIGKIPTDVDDGSYLCPNDLILGRATSRIPGGPFDESANLKQRHKFIQSIVYAYWIKWNRYYFPSLLVRKKWHTEHRNVQVGDVVLIQDSNAIRGAWKLGRVTKNTIDDDGHVRKVEVAYKNQQETKGLEYHSKTCITVERSVQRLVVILPIEEDKEDGKD